MDEDDDDDDAVLADRASPSGKRWSSLASCPSRLDLLAVHTSFVLSRLGGFNLDVPRTAHGECAVFLLVQEPGAGPRCPLT